MMYDAIEWLKCFLSYIPKMIFGIVNEIIRIVIIVHHNYWCLNHNQDKQPGSGVPAGHVGNLSN